MEQILKIVHSLTSSHYVLFLKRLFLSFFRLILLKFYLAIYYETPDLCIELGCKLEKVKKNLICQKGKPSELCGWVQL